MAAASPQPEGTYRRSDLGAYVQGWWHDTADPVRIRWEELTEGESLPGGPWRMSPADSVIIAYMADLTEPRHLDHSDERPMLAPLTTPIWTSFSVLHTRYYWSVIVDYRHAIRWERPLEVGVPTRLGGTITSVFERRGQRMLTWLTRCQAAEDPDTVFFEIEHTLLPEGLRDVPAAPRSAEGGESPRAATAAPPAEPPMTSAGTIRCDLGWSRRPAIPPHPNIHTDRDFAERHGFDEVIMPGPLVVGKAYEVLTAHLGWTPDEAMRGGRGYTSTLRRPSPVTAVLDVRIATEPVDGVLPYRIVDGAGQTVIAGEIDPNGAQA